MSLGPFDLPGSAFLELYVVLLAGAMIACLFIPAWLRPEGRGSSLADADQLAFLAGGRSRFYEALAARLLERRALWMTSKDGMDVDRRETPRNTAEASVLALPAPVHWNAIEQALAPHADPIERRLQASGLLMDDATRMQMRLWQSSPLILLFLFGAIKWGVGSARDRPVGFLTILLILTLVLGLIRFFAVDPRTRAGNRVLREAQQRSDRTRRAPAGGETEMAVALFGTAVLAGSNWNDFHRMRTANSGSSDGGSDSGGGDGGCGGGGGGCGGCGS